MNKTTKTLIMYLITFTLLGGCGNFGKPQQPPAVSTGEFDIVEYYANGNTKRKTAYLDGEITSDVKFYLTGTKESSEHYKMGEVHDATYYYSSGKIRSEIITK